jgi:N6-adenosine-specific RNA methylase IME4
MGISFNESAIWQREAAVPEPLFRRYCREMEDCGMEPKSRGLARLACNVPSSAGTPDEIEPAFSLSPVALRAMAGQGRRFGCVHAAPPWPLERPRRRDRKNFLKAITGSLCNLPVEGVCAESAHLYHWATPAAFPEAADVLAEWGFQYQSCVLWRNAADACDGLWRKGSELLLLGVRGDRAFPEGPLRRLMEAPSNSNYDRWPEFCRLIEHVSPAPYLDLFGNLPVSGWAVAELGMQ